MENDQNIPHLEDHQEVPTLDPLVPLRVDSIIQQKNMSIDLFAFDSVGVRLYPERWGIVTSLRFGDTEVFYQGMLDETLFDHTKSVKWGVPILFPNAGPLTEEQQKKSGYTLPQHGFARDNSWNIETSVIDNQLLQSLSSDNVANTSGFPFSGNILNAISVIYPDTCLFEYFIRNGSDKPLPIALGLHPYFDLPEWDKSRIEWNFDWGKQIRDEIEKWSNGGTTKIDIPSDGILDVYIPGIGDIHIEVSLDFQRLWIWSLPEKDFVCIEPVMGDSWTLVEAPVLVPPNSEHTSFMKISLRENSR